MSSALKAKEGGPAPTVPRPESAARAKPASPEPLRRLTRHSDIRRADGSRRPSSSAELRKQNLVARRDARRAAEAATPLASVPTREAARVGVDPGAYDRARRKYMGELDGQMAPGEIAAWNDTHPDKRLGDDGRPISQEDKQAQVEQDEAKQKETRFKSKQQEFRADWESGKLKDPNAILAYAEDEEVGQRLIDQIKRRTDMMKALEAAGFDFRDDKQKIIDFMKGTGKVALIAAGVPALLISIMLAGNISKAKEAFE